MNVVGAAASALKVPKIEQNAAKHSINLYMEPPNYELSLDDFEVYALKRLKVSSLNSYLEAIVFSLSSSTVLLFLLRSFVRWSN